MRVKGHIKARLQAQVRSSRRATVYKFTAKKHAGQVPCFVCGRHVTERCASLEHIIPVSKGGTDDLDNLAISHVQCNQRRGSASAA